MARTEGVAGMYRGLGPPVCMMMVMNSMNFGAFYWARDKLAGPEPVGWRWHAGPAMLPLEYTLEYARRGVARWSARNETAARWYAHAHETRVTYDHAKQALFCRESHELPCAAVRVRAQ